MPKLVITVVDPPKSWPGTENLQLFLQTKKGHEPAARTTDSEITFETEFDLRTDQSGEIQPTGPIVQRQGDGRRFVYLSWFGVQAESTGMFRRLKVFLDGLSLEEETLHIRVAGKDNKGGPACATARRLV